MSDLRDDPTPWHQAGDLADEVVRLRDTVAALRLELDRVREQRDAEAAARRYNADELWHQAGELADEVVRLRDLVGKLDAARADAELLHRGASRQLWEAHQEVDRLREKERTARHRWADALRRIIELEDAIAAHRDALAEAAWAPKACDTDLWDLLNEVDA